LWFGRRISRNLVQFELNRVKIFPGEKSWGRILEGERGTDFVNLKVTGIDKMWAIFESEQTCK